MITQHALEAAHRLSDAELIACTISTEDHTAAQAAFTHLYDRHSRGVWRFLRERVRHAPTAEDLLQEVFIRVYRKLPSLASREHFPGWLRGISRNLLLDHLRRRGRLGAEVGHLETVPDRPGRGQPPSGRLAGRDLERRIEAAIDRLPEPTSEILRLRYLEEWDVRRIATRMECEPHCVKYRLREGRQRLRWLLREAWSEYAD